MSEHRVLMVGGTVNQMRMMHSIAGQLPEAHCFFTPFYHHDSPAMALFERLGLLRYSLGQEIQSTVLAYLTEHHLPVDYRAQNGPYDLVVLGTDIYIPHNLRPYPKVLVQEGILLPQGWRYRLAKGTPLPNWIAGGHAAGLSGDYEYFCVASQGYYDWLVETGLDPLSLVVTGLPNFDNIRQDAESASFPYRDFVLVATSCSREDLRFEDRRGLLLKARAMAGGRTIIVKLHPRENVARATRQIRALLPEAIVYASGDIAPMIAHCALFLTTSSTTIFNALACDRPIECDLDLALMRRLMPEQNGCAAANIAAV